VSESPGELSDYPALVFDRKGFLHIAWEEKELIQASYESLDVFYRGGLPQNPTIYLPLVVR
ncbi:MAG: hypothetical protein P1S60_17365, partial [Anaerolineae bacterium]|nr:hypothetical protein [Anaerolineae bacterium]